MEGGISRSCVTAWPKAEQAGKPIDKHRDGTQGIYVNDPAGNVIELIYYPAGGTAYEKNAGAAVSRTV